LLAALFLALTPISVAVDRSNNTDSCLVLVLLLAAWALTKAAESQRAGFLMLSMALVGVGFNVKMGAALILVPALAATYFIAARSISPARRISNLAASGVLLVAVSLSWMAIYDLVPSDSRPYAGSTKGNSMLELALVHNGLSRFTGHSDAQHGPADPDEQGVDKTGADTQVERPHLWDESPVGLARLFRAHQAAQAG
jgi:4-amino-4-deoxy-L-arabinose transferase-like glycosyltransferase